MSFFADALDFFIAPEVALAEALFPKPKPIPPSPFSKNVGNHNPLKGILLTAGGFGGFQDVIGEVEHGIVEGIKDVGNIIFHSLKTLEQIFAPPELISEITDAINNTFGTNIPKHGIFSLTNGELIDISGVLKDMSKFAKGTGKVLIIVGILTGQPELAFLGEDVILAADLVDIADELLDKYIEVHKTITNVLGRDGLAPQNNQEPNLEKPITNEVSKDGHPIRPDVHKDAGGLNKHLPKSTFQDAIKLLDTLDLLYEQFEAENNHHPAMAHPRLQQLNENIEHHRLNESMAV